MKEWQRIGKQAKGEIAELMNKIPKLVFSRTLNQVDPIAIGWNNSSLVKGNTSAEISKLKAQGDGDMYVFGSANLSETFINENLFDEYRIGVAPIIAGSGRHIVPKRFSSKTIDSCFFAETFNWGSYYDIQSQNNGMLIYHAKQKVTARISYPTKRAAANKGLTKAVDRRRIKTIRE